MSKNDRVLVVFDVGGPTSLPQDFTEDLRRKDWMTESDVLKALKKSEFEHAYLGVFDNPQIIVDKIRDYNPTVIFNLVESFSGRLEHDRDIASYFKLLQIPFTGCGPTGLTLCKNKALSKSILRSHRIKVPQFITLKRKKPIKKPVRMRYPILIKPLGEEASYGIAQASFVETDEQFKERVQYIHEKMDRDVIAEEYIEGREIYVSIIGNKKLTVFPFREITFAHVPEGEPKIATYKVKWDQAYRKKWGIRYQFVRSMDEALEKKITRTCKRIYRLLGIRGYGRLDLRITPEGEVYFIEANPNPILAAEEDFAQSALKYGLSYPELIQKIIGLSTTHEED